MSPIVNKGENFEFSSDFFQGGEISELLRIPVNWSYLGSVLIGGDLSLLELLLAVLSRLRLSRGTSFDFSFCALIWFYAPISFWLLDSGVEPCFCLFLRASLFLLGRVESLPISLGD